MTVIIPTLNESSAIGKLLSEMPRGLLDEVIIVDSSVDDTPKIASFFPVKVIREERIGYGRALQTGIENAKGDIVVYIDGDHTYDPREIQKLIQPIFDDRHDVVLGNRLGGMMLPGSMNCLNRVGNMVLSLVFGILFFKTLSDTQTGFRAIARAYLKGLPCKDYGMSYATEQLIHLVKRGARIEEVPVTYRPRLGKTKLCAWRDGLTILKVMLRGRLS